MKTLAESREERDAYVIRRLEEGAMKKDIAAELKISSAALTSILRRLGRTRKVTRLRGARVGIMISKEIFDRFSPHANKRNMSPTALITAILEVIVEDNMVKAILDDGE